MKVDNNINIQNFTPNTQKTSLFGKTVQWVTPTWMTHGYQGIKKYTHGWKGYARLSLLGAAITLNAFMRYYVVNQFFKARSGMDDALKVDKVNEAIFDKHFLDTFYWVGAWICCEVGKELFSGLFQYAFQTNMKKQFYNCLINSGAYNGRYYLDTNIKQVDPAYVITRDSAVFIQKTSDLAVNFAGATAAFALGITHLSLLLNPSIIIGSISAVIAMKLISYIACKYIRTINQHCNKIYEEETQAVQSLNKFSESIHLNQGGPFELAELMKYIKQSYKLNNVMTSLSSFLGFVNGWKGFGAFAYGLYLFKDKLINKSMNLSDAVQVGNSLESLIGYITWSDEHNKGQIFQETAFKRIQRLEKIIDEWTQAMKTRNNVFKITNSKDGNVTFTGSITKPNGEVLFNPNNLKLIPGKVYRLTGPSGAGKSTVIRALAGIWPYVKGSLSMPKKEYVQFVPQNTYIRGGNTTLLDIIQKVRVTMFL